MAKLNELVAGLNDNEDYDGFVIVCTHGNSIKKVALGGSPFPIRSEVEGRMNTFQLLSSAMFSVSFSGDAASQDGPAEH